MREVGWFVDKVTAGVKKQLIGFIKSIRKETELEFTRTKYQIMDMQRCFEVIKKNMAKEMELDDLINEYKRNKNIIFDMKKMVGQMEDKLMDLDLSSRVISNEIIVLRDLISKIDKKYDLQEGE